MDWWGFKDVLTLVKIKSKNLDRSRRVLADGERQLLDRPEPAPGGFPLSMSTLKLDNYACPRCGKARPTTKGFPCPHCGPPIDEPAPGSRGGEARTVTEGGETYSIRERPKPSGGGEPIFTPAHVEAIEKALAPIAEQWRGSLRWAMEKLRATLGNSDAGK